VVTTRSLSIMSLLFLRVCLTICFYHAYISLRASFHSSTFLVSERKSMFVSGELVVFHKKFTKLSSDHLGSQGCMF
jgi:hypothetical protein